MLIRILNDEYESKGLYTQKETTNYVKKMKLNEKATLIKIME